MRSVFQYMAGFVAVLALMFAVVVGTLAQASDNGAARDSVKKSQSDNVVSRQITNPQFANQSEDLISGKRYIEKSHRSVYKADPRNVRLRGNPGTSDALRSITRTTQSLNRSMMSIDNSVRSMNYSINHIRTFRRRF